MPGQEANWFVGRSQADQRGSIYPMPKDAVKGHMHHIGLDLEVVYELFNEPEQYLECWVRFQDWLVQSESAFSINE